MKQLHITIAFFRSGILGYGGGPSAIPLVHKEVVQTFKWMSDDEFADILALANTLPGPINTKMAGYIGYRVGGIAGMLNAVLSTTLPTIVLMIVLLASLSSVKSLPWVSGMTKAVVPVVGVMMLTLTWDFYKKSYQSLGLISASAAVVGSLLLLEVLHIHPAFLIVAILLFAVIKKDKAAKGEGGRE